MKTGIRFCAFSILLASNSAPVFAEVVSGTLGPHQVEMIVDPNLPGHAVFRPADLAGLSDPVPFIAFGNGGCINHGNRFGILLAEVASHGYVLTAPGPILAADGQPAGPAGARPEQSDPGQMIDAIDWAVAQSNQEGGKYEGKMDISNIAVMGQSCGGLEAIAAGADERVSTVLVFNSGIIRGSIPNPDGTVRQPAGYLPATEEDLVNIHTPILYLIGGETDQAYRGAEGDFQDIEGVPVFNANLDVGHGGTWRQPNAGVMGQVALDWLDWQLKDDRESGRTFTGGDCGLCRDDSWVVKTKNFD